MGDTKVKSCSVCRNTDQDFPYPGHGPDRCLCCDVIFCGPCWRGVHMRFFQ